MAGAVFGKKADAHQHCSVCRRRTAGAFGAVELSNRQPEKPGGTGDERHDRGDGVVLSLHRSTGVSVCTGGGGGRQGRRHRLETVSPYHTHPTGLLCACKLFFIALLVRGGNSFVTLLSGSDVSALRKNDGRKCSRGSCHSGHCDPGIHRRTAAFNHALPLSG